MYMNMTSFFIVSKRFHKINYSCIYLKNYLEEIRFKCEEHVVQNNQIIF